MRSGQAVKLKAAAGGSPEVRSYGLKLAYHTGPGEFVGCRLRSRKWREQSSDDDFVTDGYWPITVAYRSLADRQFPLHKSY